MDLDAKCQRLAAVAAELMQTLEGLLQANQDAAAPGGLGPFLYEIHRLGLRATVAKCKADLAEIAVDL